MKTAAEVNVERIAVILSEHGYIWCPHELARLIVTEFPELRGAQQSMARDGASRLPIVAAMTWAVEV